MSNAPPRTSVHPDGFFQIGMHRPSYQVINLRKETPEPGILGTDGNGTVITNDVNFPPGTVFVEQADAVVEIANPFPFWGSTYILDASAERCSEKDRFFTFNPFTEDMRTEDPAGFMAELMSGSITGRDGRKITIDDLPEVLQLALAQNSRDSQVLVALARSSCDFEYGPDGEPAGLRYRQCQNGQMRPFIRDFNLFKTVSNNPALPDSYKHAMVLKPGIQGTSPVVGEYGLPGERTHIFEYLRANSYIPYGHFAANMADDAVRYSVKVVDQSDMSGLRALYYQRIYVNMALALEILESPDGGSRMEPLAHDPVALDKLRCQVLDEVNRRRDAGEPLPYTATLWGWNYGYDFSPSGYRLHASHQMVHQQFALIPPFVAVTDAGNQDTSIPTYAIGDQVADFVARYEEFYNTDFFDAYQRAIENNCRIDGRDHLDASLILWEDENVMLHAPKAQRSQGEVQIMVKKKVGNILEADTPMRASLDQAVLRAVKTLAGMGAEMITCYEVSRRFDSSLTGQRLFYCFLPRHSRSPGAFSERQGRWITGHYPEDYAHCFRDEMNRQFG